MAIKRVSMHPWQGYGSGAARISLNSQPRRSIAKPVDRHILTAKMKIQWIHSYVTDDKIYCIYFTRDEALILEARLARLVNSSSPLRDSCSSAYSESSAA